MLVGGLVALGLDLALPADANTWTVTNCNDSGPGSLRQAVADAGSGDTINFAPSPACSVIVLSSGPIDITTDLSLDGPGSTSLAVDGNETVQDFMVDSDVTATIAGLTVENGETSATGGRIANDGTLTLSNSTVSDDTSQDLGGGIANVGT